MPFVFTPGAALAGSPIAGILGTALGLRAPLYIGALGTMLTAVMLLAVPEDGTPSTPSRAEAVE